MYPSTITERLLQPSNCGTVESANAVGTDASFECGSFVRIRLRIEPGSKRICDAGFGSNGCGFMTASADAICDGLKGRELTSLNAADEAEMLSMTELAIGPLPKERYQCASVAVRALRDALGDFRSWMLEEFRGEQPLICTCFGVAERTIEDLIAAGVVHSVDEVTEKCRAGGGCGSCRMLIQEMIDDFECTGPQ